MARPELAGWNSTERSSPTGDVWFEQRVRATKAPVERSEAGALALGERYWMAVESVTRRLVRVGRRGPELELRLFGRLTLLRFGAPEIVVDESGILSRYSIAGGLLARGPAGSITFAQTSGADATVDLRATVEDFLPRLAGRPGGPAWTRAIYRQVQQRLHTAISRRYFRRLIEGPPR